VKQPGEKSFMLKVNFLIAGAQKCGTTALNRYLRMHPELGMPRQKELHFFDNETLFSGTPVDYSDYHAAFSACGSQHMYGEATPDYMYWTSTPGRLREYNPAMKIIIILRNPVDRAFSGWHMEHQRNREFLSFGEAIKNERERIREVLPFQHRVYSYVDRGYYTEQIRRIWSYFPEEQTLFLRMEDLRTTPQTVLDRICQFLGVSGMAGVRPATVAAKSRTPAMTNRERAYLKELYEFEIKELERMLGWNCRAWLDA
jgi:hypothetical protein